MDIILTGLQKFDQSTEDEQLDEMAENNLTFSSGYTLENIARVCGNDVMQPVFNFITPKFASPNWGDRYVGMIAFGSIIDGPNSQDMANTIATAYADIVNMINDQVPKVRQTVAFVLYKLSEFVPEIIFMSQQNLDLFVNRCLEHIQEHHLISTLVIGALKNLFTNACRAGAS
jgi:importin subunit beta-1